MYKLGELILFGGVLLFIVGGICTIFNLIPTNSSIISLSVVQGLIFIGVGCQYKLNQIIAMKHTNYLISFNL